MRIRITTTQNITKMKKEELIKAVNDGDFYSMWDIQDNVFDGSTGTLVKVAEGLNRKDCGWYIKATDVYLTEDGYVGITGPTELTVEKELGTWEDCCKVTAREYVEVATYAPKK